jgi:hypothetical protein
MLLKTWRFITIMLTALALGTAFCHLLELPPKMSYDAPLNVMLHRTLYTNYGRIGGVAETLALVTAIGLAWRVRKRREAFPLTVAAAACLVAGMAAFLALVRPANLTMFGWPLDAIPPDWTRWRTQWEYTHAARAFLMMGALAALILSVLREIPGERRGGHPEEQATVGSNAHAEAIEDLAARA